jgi:hypothetical protein
MNLRYYLQGSPNEHAQTVMKQMGITYQQAVPQSIADQWWFFNCENVPDELPAYIEPLTNDPMSLVGYGLTEEDARKIKEWKGSE